MGRELLTAEAGDLRIAGVILLERACDNPALESLLCEYVGNPLYYYDVVTWLDRCLYASGRFGEGFRARLRTLSPLEA